MNSIVKNLLILFVCCIIFISCEEGNTYTSSPVVSPTSSSEKIIIKAGFNNYVYTKIVIENHEYYFRTWATRGGYGSNLVHNPNCSTCKNKNYE